jgi:hypothetical protein
MLHRNQFNKIPNHLPIYGTDKKASCVQKSTMVLDDKRGGTSCKKILDAFFLSVFFLVMFLAQISYNFYTILTTFLRLTIRFLRPTYKKTDPMVDHKKKIKTLLELYNFRTTLTISFT